MKVTVWKTDIHAPSKRDLDLKHYEPVDTGGLRLSVEDESGDFWQIEFVSIQAFRMLAEEFSGRLLESLPQDGSMFVIEHSSWLAEVSGNSGVEKATHYLICFYDEVVEVLAADCLISKQ